MWVWEEEIENKGKFFYVQNSYIVLLVKYKVEYERGRM